MAKDEDKGDLRNGLPGHEGSTAVDKGALRVEDAALAEDTQAASEPQVVTPEVGKNIPWGQTTKG